MKDAFREDPVGSLMALALVAWALFQPVAPGPAVGAALTLLGLYLVNLARRRAPFGTPGRLVAALAAALVLATVFAPEPAPAVGFALKYWHFALVPAVAAIPASAFLRFRKALAACGALSLALALLAGLGDLLFRWNFKWDVLSRHGSDRDREMVYGFFSHHMTFAGFVAVVAFSLAGVAFFDRDARARRYAGLASAAAGLLLLAARKRAYWIGGGVGLLLLAVRLRTRRALALVVAVAFLFVAGYAGSADVRDRVQRAFQTEDNQQRVGFWIVGWQMAKDRPLLGWGPGGYRLHGEPYLSRVFATRGGAEGYRDNFTHVHDVYLQLLVEGGVVLLAAYLALLGWILARTGRDWWARGSPGSAEAWGAGVFTMLATLSLAGVFEWNVMDKEVGIPMMVSMGIYLLLKDQPAPATP